MSDKVLHTKLEQKKNVCVCAIEKFDENNYWVYPISSETGIVPKNIPLI